MVRYLQTYNKKEPKQENHHHKHISEKKDKRRASDPSAGVLEDSIIATLYDLSVGLDEEGINSNRMILTMCKPRLMCNTHYNVLAFS
jgi:hypothetical protein